ncbi:MAG: sigma 54-interacting transcriptional regulator [Planctomycetes bacterium]|nr:sigma 54-interacting transcriptional regulator [Planctomycetota bacterium]
MKTRKPLSGYLEQIKIVLDNKNWAKVKYYGEIAAKRISSLKCSPIEKYYLYYYLGTAYSQLSEYSESLEACYKAQSIALKHTLPAAYLSIVHYGLGLNLSAIGGINQALYHFQKVEEYYQKYGDAAIVMDKNSYIKTLIELAFCYLAENKLGGVQEIIEKKLPRDETFLSTGFIGLHYHHLVGEYQIAIKKYDDAAQSFKECIRISEQDSFPEKALEAKIHLAMIEILKSQLDSAVAVLEGIAKDARRLKLNDLVCESLLLLSKCYFLNNMPQKAEKMEKRIKPIVSNLDITWFYEKTREFERFFRQLSALTKTSYSVPSVLVQTLGYRCELSFTKEIVIGKSPLMRDVWQLLEKVAPTDLPVLIQGETGTGKEVIANAIHQNSHRKDKQWLAINAGVPTETLLENHLFGHTKGAFTDAKEDKKGYIELTSNGTLFIDEIANMSPVMQQKLLRVSEEKLLWRVGAQKPIPVDTRFVFASNQDVEQMVKNKLFREDLFYRINTIVINLPPLRDRKEDIPLLTQHFLRKCSIPRKEIPEVSPSTLALLVAYPWPGNVRELENEIKRICILYPDAKTITETMLSEPIQNYKQTIHSSHSLTFKELKKIAEKNIIIDILTKCNGNISQAARLLKYGRANLHNKIKQLNISYSSDFVSKR